MNKTMARKTGIQARKTLSFQKRKKKSDSILSQLIPFLEKAETVGCYVSIYEEVDTTEILFWCLLHEKILCVPKVEGNTLVFYRICKTSDLQKGKYGIPEPVHGNRIPLSSIDLMLVPVVAFDENGNRCGYGKGYYDSVLKYCRKKIGLAFSEQKIDCIEKEEQDVSLDRIITA